MYPHQAIAAVVVVVGMMVEVVVACSGVFAVGAGCHRCNTR